MVRSPNGQKSRTQKPATTLKSQTWKWPEIHINGQESQIQIRLERTNAKAVKSFTKTDRSSKHTNGQKFQMQKPAQTLKSQTWEWSDNHIKMLQAPNVNMVRMLKETDRSPKLIYGQITQENGQKSQTWKRSERPTKRSERLIKRSEIPNANTVRTPKKRTDSPSLWTVSSPNKMVRSPKCESGQNAQRSGQNPQTYKDNSRKSKRENCWNAQ